MEVYYHLTEFERNDLKQKIQRYVTLYPSPQHITIEPIENRNLTLATVDSTSSDLELHQSYFRPVAIKMTMTICTDGQIRLIPHSEEVNDLLKPRALSPAPPVLVGYVDATIPSHRDTVMRIKKFFAINPPNLRLEIFVSSIKTKLLNGAGQHYDFGPENHLMSVPITPDQVAEIFETSQPTEIPYSGSSTPVSTTDANLGTVLTGITQVLQRMNDTNVRTPPDNSRYDAQGSQSCLHQRLMDSPLPAELQGLNQFEAYGFLNYNRNGGETIEDTIQRVTNRYRRQGESSADCIFRMVRNSQNFGNVCLDDDHYVPPGSVSSAAELPVSGASSRQSTAGSATTSILTSATNTSSSSTSGTSTSGSGATGSSSSTASSASSASSSSVIQSSQPSTAGPSGSQTSTSSQNTASLTSSPNVVSAADSPVMSPGIQQPPGSVAPPVCGAQALDAPGRRPLFPGAEPLTPRHSDLNIEEDSYHDTEITTPSRLNLSVAAFSFGSEQFLSLVGELPALDGLDDARKLQVMDTRIKKVRSVGS